MNDHGLLQRKEYREASFSRLHVKAPAQIKRLCRKFSEVPAKRFFDDVFSFYVYGRYRVGKTWFMHAMANHILNVYKEESVYYITAPDIQARFQKNATMKDGATLWVSYLSATRVLFLDDLGQDYRGSGSGFIESKLEAFLRWRFNHGKITFIGSNGAPDQLKQLYGESFSAFVLSEFVMLEIDSDVNMSEIIREEKLRH